MRGILIASGAALLSHFHWVIFIFGGFLVVGGGRMAFHDRSRVDPNRNIAVRLFKRFIPTYDEYDGGRYLTRVNGRLFATPLLVVVVAVEATDLIFAIDSIPEILAVTDDTFIVYTSNILAMLGLRAMYFALAGGDRQDPLPAAGTLSRAGIRRSEDARFGPVHLSDPCVTGGGSGDPGSRCNRLAPEASAGPGSSAGGVPPP